MVWKCEMCVVAEEAVVMVWVMLVVVAVVDE